MSFLFYDFETTGADPRCDRPIQFAALRTNDALEPIEPPITYYATLSPEVLPHPQAVLITGILPQTLFEAGGTPEAEFAAHIHRAMMRPDTCAVGFNSLRFDAELLRFMFWRNLRDPYAHEWKNGNSRWDVLDAARAVRLLRPEGIQWPSDEQGKPTLRLSALTSANAIAHTNAHDALGDVEATVALARLLRAQSPKLFDYLLNLRKKTVVADFVDAPEREAFVHVSGRISGEQGSASVFANLGMVGGVSTQRLLWDLRFDPTQVLDEAVDTLSARRFLCEADAAPGEHRLPIKLLHLNRAPVVVSTAILNEASVVERMRLDTAAVHRHQQALRRHRREIAEKLQEVIANQAEFAAQDAECALYDGFMPTVDRSRLDAFNRVFDQAISHSSAALQEEKVTTALKGLLTQSWQDVRLPTVVMRYVARTRPDLLDAPHRAEWQAWVHARLMQTAEHPTANKALGYTEFFTTIDDLLENEPSGETATRAVLRELRAWGVDHAADHGQQEGTK
ncbi:MAG: exodeoxyribonuclease I [Halothiobacillus sp.]